MYGMLRNTVAGLVVLVGAGALTPAAAQQSDSPASYIPDVTFTLKTEIGAGGMLFVGEGGSIHGVTNPDLKVPEHAVVQINLINDDGVLHDLVLPDFGVRSEQVTRKGSSTSVVFRVAESGEFTYLCSIPGHQAAGMAGRLIVGDGNGAKGPELPELAADPNAVGEPVGDRDPVHHVVDLRTTELEGRLGNGTSYTYWTFDDQVPGPFLRIREGDSVTVNLTNPQSSNNVHSIDFHAVTGPGGGAEATQVAPGQTRSFSFKAMAPGLYVYHCATPMVAHHISNGMYGLILVEPEGGLAPVDREFYVMQGELYTDTTFETGKGRLEFSAVKLLYEMPEYYVFNGSVGALTSVHRMEAEVGDTVRIYFGVGGPNKVSSFHVIGEIFDRVYHEGDLTSPPRRDVQTTLVAPGGATMVEFQVDVPGRYILVDHALSRAERGLVGFLHVDGEEQPEIFHEIH